jgi:hypothetical protein
MVKKPLLVSGHPEEETYQTGFACTDCTVGFASTHFNWPIYFPGYSKLNQNIINITCATWEQSTGAKLNSQQ